MNEDYPKKEWIGTFIPREIWDHPELSWMDKCLWGEIRSLDNEEYGGCFASNFYLAKKMGSTEKSISKKICQLKKLGIIADVSFDGRKRVIKAIDPSSIHPQVKPASTHRDTQHPPTGRCCTNPEVDVEYSIDKKIERSTAIYAEDGENLPESDCSTLPEKQTQQNAKDVSLPPIPFDKFLDRWNSTELPKIERWTEQRKQKLRTRWKDQYFRENWEDAISTAADSDFLCGKCRPRKEGEKPFAMDFNWFVKNDENFTKIMEGKYGKVRRSSSEENLTREEFIEKFGVDPLTLGQY